MASKELINTINQYDNFIKTHLVDESVISAYVEACKVAINGEKDIEYGLQLTKISKGIIEQFCMKQTGGTIWDLEKYAQEHNTPYDLIDKYYELLKLESYYNFESFMYYMERKRNWSKRFYYPRRKTLKVVVNDLEDLENRKIKFYGLSMPSRVGKSTICIFFLAWVAMRRPNSHSAMGGHSGILAKGFYKELMNLFSTEEYAFDELFFFWNPEYANKSLVTDKSADEFTITLGDPDRFATVTCRGIDGTWTGAVDVSKDGYLYVDDLVRDREHSLSPTRMENTYQEYLNKMVDRKNDGARELMVGTLWNVLDPLERLRKSYDGNPEYRFRRIPALDENDESNFDYEINGFSTAYYRDMREKLDKAEWEAKFMQRPFVREGLLFPTDELRYFNGILPDGDFRRIGVVDVAWGGGDSLSMPIGAEYDNGDVYIYDWVFNKGAKEVTLPLVVGRIIGNGIRQTRFEGNTGGAKLKDPIVKSAEKRLANVVLNILRVNDNDLKLSTRDFDVQINHSPQDNMYTKAQTLTVLLQAGIHPLIAIATVGLWGDAEKTFNLSKPYLKNLYKTIDDAETQKAKAQEIVDQINKKNKAITE